MCSGKNPPSRTTLVVLLLLLVDAVHAMLSSPAAAEKVVLPNNINNNRLLFSVGPYDITEALPYCHHKSSASGALFRAIRTDVPPPSLTNQKHNENKNTTARTYLLKMLLGSATMQPAMRDRLRHEFTVLQELEGEQVDGVVRPVELISTPERGLVLVLQDQDLHRHQQHGHTLRQLITRKAKDKEHHHKNTEAKQKNERMALKQFFMIAIGVVEVLQRLHKRGYVHKDIKPDSIMVFVPLKKEEGKGGGGGRREDEEVKVQLLDFGICGRYHPQPRAQEEERKTGNEEKEEKTEGTWAYMSPEQTGRTKRLVDHRTDFYSLGMQKHLFIFRSFFLLFDVAEGPNQGLKFGYQDATSSLISHSHPLGSGVTLFELVTGGCLPFKAAAADPLEVVFHHLAVVPPRANQIDPIIPEEA